MINRKGTAYVEYFLAAIAVALASLWLFNGGAYRGVASTINATFEAQMTRIQND